MSKRKIRVVKIDGPGWIVVTPVYGFGIKDQVTIAKGFRSHREAFISAHRRAATSGTNVATQVNTSIPVMRSWERLDWV